MNKAKAVTKADVEEVLGATVRLAKRTLEAQGKLPPGVVMLLPSHKLAVCPLAFEDTAQKRQVYRAVGALADMLGALAVLLVNDSWMAVLPKGANPYEAGPVSQRKDRTEAVIVVCHADALEASVMVTLPYERKRGKIVWGEEKRSTEFQDMLAGGSEQGGLN